MPVSCQETASKTPPSPSNATGVRSPAGGPYTKNPWVSNPFAFSCPHSTALVAPTSLAGHVTASGNNAGTYTSTSWVFSFATYISSDAANPTAFGNPGSEPEGGANSLIFAPPVL